jgi:glucosylceramidase
VNRKFILCLFVFSMAAQLHAQKKTAAVQIFETAANGNKLKQINQSPAAANAIHISINPNKRYQTITGFGGSFTEASASLLNKLSKANRENILKAYFSKEGADYSLTRTHINSCDFSLSNYAYANVPGDKNLEHFSIDEDRNDLIPMIKAAQQFSKDGFKIIASPWTAPPWMKDNTDWRGGKLLPEYRETWALYFSKYIQAYKKEGINIWGITVENEPLGNDKNWESMHFTPEEMRDFVRDYLGPQFEKDGLSHIPILGYDQNRGDELEKWAKTMFEDKKAAKYFGGTAVHWYASTYDFFPASLQYTHQLSPTKHLINTEACVDAEVPKWNDDNWYWSKEATDWGWDWASEKEKYLHPKYAPVFRYAGDIIGCLNNYVDGWIDWNMVLDKQGGPNWFKNWCTAPVIVDEEKDEVYFTPLYYTIAHFSKFIRPGAVRIGFECADKDLMVTAVENPDASVVVIVFNPSENEKAFAASVQGQTVNAIIHAKAIQTLVFNKKNKTK